MGAPCNRMQPRVVTVGFAAPTTIFGLGREGVMNGGANLSVTVDGTASATGKGSTGIPGTAGIVTVTIYYRTMAGSQLVADATTVAIPIAGKVVIQISPPNTSVYEIQMTAQVAAPAVGDNLVIVSSLTERV